MKNSVAKTVIFLSKRYLPAIVWMILIFILSSQSALPGPSTMPSDFIFKKLSHIFFYGILYFLLFRAVNGNGKGRSWWIPFLLGLLYALSDEFHQHLVAGRTSRIRDIGYDVLGMFIASAKMKGYI